MAVVTKGCQVTLHYVGKFDDGKIFDTTLSNSPFTYEVGSNVVLPQFEKNILGMAIGEKKTFLILEGDAYGPIRGSLVIEVPLEKFPQHIKPEVGMRLNIPLKGLRVQYPVRVLAVSDISVTIDANHPLAGKNLRFEVEILEID
ncbi:MAG: peptidylprolyl isomerase [Chlamydiota bacterium]|nr:peptidylprolyl isomerase [Chlamydiota bacterium]